MNKESVYIDLRLASREELQTLGPLVTNLLTSEMEISHYYFFGFNSSVGWVQFSMFSEGVIKELISATELITMLNKEQDGS